MYLYSAVQVFERKEWEQLLGRSVVPKLAFALQVAHSAARYQPMPTAACVALLWCWGCFAIFVSPFFTSSETINHCLDL